MITSNTFTIILGIALLFSSEVKTDDEGESSEGNSTECVRTETSDRQCTCVMQIESRSNDDLITLIQHMFSDNRENLNLKQDVQNLQETVENLQETIENLVTFVQQLRTNPVNIGVKDCKDLYDQGYHESGVYTLNLDTQVSVYCDQVYNGGGWTVIQNRFDGSVDFYKTWNEYKFGFGNPAGEHWLGNKYLHLITNRRPQRIRFELEDFEGNTAWAEYENFVISDESDDFRMNIDITSYTGTAGDSLKSVNSMKFSTKDRDNDDYSDQCSVKFNGAWWFKDCFGAHLNGIYHNNPRVAYAQGLIWYHWKNSFYYSVKKTTMKIKPM